MKLLFAVLICIASFLLSCAHQPTYVEQLSERPYPSTEQDIANECAWIRSEIARMNSLSAMSATSQYALAFQAISRQNIAALESRAANLRCGAAFSSTIAIEKQRQTSSIDECIKACRKNTNRTPEQCFDACNK